MPIINVSLSNPVIKVALDELSVEKNRQTQDQAQPSSEKQHEMIDKQKVLQVLNSGQLDKFEVKQDQNGTTVTFTVKKPGILRGQEQQPMQAAAAKKKKKSKDWNPNPWAACHKTVDKDKNPDKYEKCVMDVKKKQASYSKSFITSMGLEKIASDLHCDLYDGK